MADRPFPTDVYLDTSFVVAAIIAGAKAHQACSAFSDRLAAQGRRVYFSQVLRLELSQAALNLVQDKRRLPKEIRDGYHLSQWRGNLMVRQRWLTFVVAQFNAFLEQFDTAYELPFRLRIWQRSVNVMADETLESCDAIHVATARHAGITDFATIDPHFAHVADLRLWPDSLV